MKAKGNEEMSHTLSIQLPNNSQALAPASSLVGEALFPNLWVGASSSFRFQSNVGPSWLSYLLLPSSHHSASWHLVLTWYHIIWNFIIGLIIVSFPRSDLITMKANTSSPLVTTIFQYCLVHSRLFINIYLLLNWWWFIDGRQVIKKKRFGRVIYLRI